MEQLCSTQQVSVSNSSSQRQLDARQRDVEMPVAGLEKIDRIKKKKKKQHKLTVNEHRSRQAGLEWRQRLAEAKSQQA